MKKQWIKPGVIILGVSKTADDTDIAGFWDNGNGWQYDGCHKNCGTFNTSDGHHPNCPNRPFGKS